MDVMLDLESLSTRPDAVILTLGAVKFDPYTPDHFGDTLYLRIDVDTQIADGRYVEEDTIDWWGRQHPDVREEALGVTGRVSVMDTIKQLSKFLVGVKNIWAQGSVFDIGCLENFYRQYGVPAPWYYWQIRDSRTLFGVHGDPREKNKLDLHNALADCVSQAQAVQEIYSALKIPNPKIK